MIGYNKTFVEVDEILNYLYKEDLEKIPKDMRQLIKENKDKEYIWKYDESKEFKDQDVSCETIAFLSYLNMEYLINEKQKELMEQMHELNERKLEQQKQQEYSADGLFSDKEKEIKENVVNKEEVSSEDTKISVYKQNIFSRIFNKIKNIFKIR